MKICFLSHSSVIFNYREKIRLLAEHPEVDLTLLVPEIWPEAGSKVRMISDPSGKEGFPILSLPLFFPGRVKRHFYPSFFSHVRGLRPDIIHVEEEPYSFAAWQALRAARRLKAGFVFFTWENLLEKFPIPHRQIRSYVLRNADFGIAGDTEAAGLLSKAGFPASKTTVLPQYGVNPDLFKKTDPARTKKELRLGPFTVGYIGRLVPEKGIYHLVQAFAALQDRQANLLIVGNGPLREPLEQMAARSGVNGRIRWVAAVDQGLIPEYLNCMDVLVLPSLTTPMWKEQFGRVLIEAQACEVPVVGSDSGAIPEVIGPAGFIFPEGDVPALAGTLDRLAASRPLREEFGKKGRERVLRLFTNRLLADRILEVYRGVLDGRSRSSQ